MRKSRAANFTISGNCRLRASGPKSAKLKHKQSIAECWSCSQPEVHIPVLMQPCRVPKLGPYGLTIMCCSSIVRASFIFDPALVPLDAKNPLPFSTGRYRRDRLPRASHARSLSRRLPVFLHKRTIPGTVDMSQK